MAGRRTPGSQFRSWFLAFLRFWACRNKTRLCGGICGFDVFLILQVNRSVDISTTVSALVPLVLFLIKASFEK